MYFDGEDRFAVLRKRPDITGRPLAPGPLAGIHAFVNTVDLEHIREWLGSPAELAAWLDDANLLAPGAAPPDEDDVRRALELREALRALLLANVTGEPADASARGVLEATADRAHLAVRFPPGYARGTLVPAADGAAGALGTLVAIAYDAMADGSWRRLKACPRDRCHAAFYDRSRNVSGIWCDMAVCGSREKAATYYRRVRSAAP
jgi:predicted RNA-binding Zn ribbon-like protein